MTQHPQPQTPRTIAQKAGDQFRLAMARDMARLHAHAMPKATAADLKQIIKALENRVQKQPGSA